MTTSVPFIKQQQQQYIIIQINNKNTQIQNKQTNRQTNKQTNKQTNIVLVLVWKRTSLGVYCLLFSQVYLYIVCGSVVTYVTWKVPLFNTFLTYTKTKPGTILKMPPLLQVLAGDGGSVHVCWYSHMKASTSECMSAALRSGWWERAQCNPEE